MFDKGILLMQLTKETFSDLYPVQTYEPGLLKVNDTLFSQPVMLIMGQPAQNWAIKTFDDLSIESLETIIAQAPDVILLGTGTTLRFPAPALSQQVIQKGIGIEIMDTGAACRTYNLLLAEGRKVAAALFI